MAGRTVSGYVEEGVADRLSEIASLEDRKPASIVGQAIGFYVALPEPARTTLRRIEALALPEEKQWLRREFMRLLFKVDMGLTQRRMANEVAPNLPAGDSEEELEQAAVDWSDGFGR